jgi:hypothetical protein
MLTIDPDTINTIEQWIRLILEYAKNSNEFSDTLISHYPLQFSQSNYPIDTYPERYILNRIYEHCLMGDTNIVTITHIELSISDIISSVIRMKWASFIMEAISEKYCYQDTCLRDIVPLNIGLGWISLRICQRLKNDKGRYSQYYTEICDESRCLSPVLPDELKSIITRTLTENDIRLCLRLMLILNQLQIPIYRLITYEDTVNVLIETFGNLNVMRDELIFRLVTGIK